MSRSSLEKEVMDKKRETILIRDLQNTDKHLYKPGCEVSLQVWQSDTSFLSVDFWDEWCMNCLWCNNN